MKKLCALFLVVAGFAAIPLTQASAREAAVVTTAALPAFIHLDETVIIERHRHYYHHHHYYHHYHHRYYYRHGVRHYY